eukprot:gene11180-13212_t
MAFEFDSMEPPDLQELTPDFFKNLVGKNAFDNYSQCPDHELSNKLSRLSTGVSDSTGEKRKSKSAAVEKPELFRGNSKESAIEMITDSDDEAPKETEMSMEPDVASVGTRKSKRARKQTLAEKFKGLKALYPSPEYPKAIAVLADDLRRVDACEMLNDSVIDFFLMYITHYQLSE